MTFFKTEYFSTLGRVRKFPKQFGQYQNLVFAGIPLANRSVLDIGGGDGLMSFYAAAHGANRVLCLEPSAAGSNPRMEATFRELSMAMPQANVRLERETFQRFESQSEVFDVVLIHHAINHLDEESCANLHRDAYARDVYRDLFRRLADVTTSRGHLIVADASRYNAFGSLGLPSPFAPSIDWRIHQPPHRWEELLEECGYSEAVTRWSTVVRLGRAGQVLLGNKLGSFLTNSHFILKMRRIS